MNILYRDDYGDDHDVDDGSYSDDDDVIEVVHTSSPKNRQLRSSYDSTSSPTPSYDSEKSMGLTTTPQQNPKKTLREQFVRAISSPARALTSPTHTNKRHSKSSSLRRKFSSPKSSQKENKGWWEDLDLPAGITREEAMAILVCRELEMIDL